MYVTTDCKRDCSRNRNLFTWLFFFFFPTLNKDSEGGIVEWLIHSFHLPMLGIFALMCPFQVDLLSFFLHLWYLLGICLCIHGLCWASFTVTSVSVTLHLLLLLPVLIFFTYYLHVGDLKLIFLLHHDLIVLSYSSGVLLGLRKRCGLFSCSLFWGSFVLFLYPYQVHLVAFTGDGNMKQQC